MTTPTPNNMPGAHADGQQPHADAPVQSPINTPAVDPTPPQAEPTSSKSPWEQSGEPFDPERAWSLIQKLRTEGAELKTKISAAQPILDEYEQLRRASQTDTQRLTEDLDAATSSTQTWRGRAVRAETKALAADRFVDADVALALIGDVSDYIDGDDVDTVKLSARLDQLAADKPFLVKTPPPTGFTPNRGQGQSGTGQLPLDAQIRAAQERGDLMASIALKQQMLYQK